MRKILLASFILFGLFSAAQNKIALIVAVGDYPDGGKWRDLSSLNDLRYMKAALIRNGFDPKAIDTLVDRQATKANILAALEALYNRSKPGDIVVFHFSGHGQQIQDESNGDEADGYDEALIPWDAKAMYDAVSYQGKNHLRDDELKVIMTKIRTRIGSRGSLVMIVDACHSGTINRSNEFSICRGEPIPFKAPEYKPKNVMNMADIVARRDGFSEAAEGALSNMIVFSASSPNQVNYETKDADGVGVGSLSYAFAKAISDLPANSDYFLLFQKIKARIQAEYPTQLPMIEGAMSQQVFSNAYVTRDEIVFINDWLNDSTFIVNSGILDNIGKGSTFKIYIVGGSEPVATGKITQANVFQSVGGISGRLDKTQAYHVKWDALASGSFSASLFINTPKTAGKQIADIKRDLAGFIKTYPFLSINDNADYMIDLQPLKNGGTGITVMEKGDSTRLTLQLAKGAMPGEKEKQQILDNIKMALRVKYLRSLNDGGKLANGVTVEIIPPGNASRSAEIFMKPLDEYSFKITNNTGQKLYYTVIDIMPDNTAKVLIPDESEMPQERVLLPGDSMTIDGIQVDEGTPRGKEFFKVIVSKTPLDLRSIFNRRRSRSTEDMMSLENMLVDMFQDEHDKSPTRSNLGAIKIDEVGILTTGFTVWTES